jgi:hypothetical protein
MNEQHLQKAIKNHTNVLKPVMDASYSPLKTLSTVELIDIATSTNKALGFDLFDDLYGYPRLATEFALVARAVSNNAIPARKGE